MSICVAVKESEIDLAADLLGDRDFKFICLFESDGMEEHLEDLNIDLLRDCNIFSQSYRLLANVKMKENNAEKPTMMKKIVDSIIQEERQLCIVNNYNSYKNIVIVFSNKFINRGGQRDSKKITLTDDDLDLLINEFSKTLFMYEGLKIYTLDEYRSGVNIDVNSDWKTFNERQQALIQYETKSFTSDLYNKFEEAFKFRLISYYCKIRQYSLDEVMIQLRKLGVLDSRFDGEIYIYEEEAKRLLARRLCTMSFKNDIELLINKGIIPADKLKYDI